MPCSHVEKMMAFSILTPYYDEDVLYKPEKLRLENDGISTLFYLQKIYEDEWKNFMERIYEKALEMLSFLDSASEMDVRTGSYQIASHSSRNRNRSLDGLHSGCHHQQGTSGIQVHLARDEVEYYSVLVKYDQQLQREVEIYRIRLPGPLKLGGKPENQNHAMIFTRTNYGIRKPTILGVRENIFTGSVSSLAWFMSAQETKFCDPWSACFGKPFKGANALRSSRRFDRFWWVGRDVGLNQISMFEAKVASGNGEQVLSRDVYRLGHSLGFPDNAVGACIFILHIFYGNSHPFLCRTILHGGKVPKATGRGGMFTSAEHSWETWWHEEQDHLRTTGLWGKWKHQHSCLFAILDLYGSGSWDLHCYGICGEKYAVKKHIYYRLVQLLVIVVTILVIVILLEFTHFKFLDIVTSLMAFIPTGWGMISIALVLRPFLQPTVVWDTVVSLARLYDAVWCDCDGSCCLAVVVTWISINANKDPL
ncbi:hypothetical protein FNV43_RR07253 [Rhamnella rubrinervis]|uniref:Glycosyl transferase 48 domain-containing protein n=1 Tax=Rhamnella rubrinervis TaxID=2594499 RepID=A0A8K0MM10_9ROSA|nr:hypothetical protein FNV43_RR07253 [Rhamnella rubrinervis]